MTKTIVILVALFAAAVALRAAWSGRHGRFPRGSAAEIKRVRLGRGRGIDELATRLGKSAGDLRSFMPIYRTRLIPKRSGGTRVLHIPNDATKALQRTILRRLLARLRAHSGAHGFEPGRSIVTHARLHAGKRVVIKADVRDFFSATAPERVVEYFQWVGWDRPCAELLGRLCTHEGGLPQGAPTSPRLSNLVNRRLDSSLARLAKRCRCEYSRYADDIVFSASWKKTAQEGVLARGVVQMLRRRLARFGYQLNGKKVRILRPHQQQRVTGLVVNEKPDLPRRVRRRLRAVEHRLRTGGHASMTKEQLAGWAALRAMIRAQRGDGGN